jgi:hypothetical protein
MCSGFERRVFFERGLTIVADSTGEVVAGVTTTLADMVFLLRAQFRPAGAARAVETADGAGPLPAS